jgi:hypothetical protein
MKRKKVDTYQPNITRTEHRNIYLNNGNCPLLFMYDVTFQGYILDTIQDCNMNVHGCVEIHEEKCHAQEP